MPETKSPLTAFPVPGAGKCAKSGCRARDKNLPRWLLSRLIILIVVKHRPGRQRAGAPVKGNRKPSGPQGKDVFNSSSGPRAKVTQKFGTGSSFKYCLSAGEIRGRRE